MRQCDRLCRHVRAARDISLFVRHDVRHDVHVRSNDTYVYIYITVLGRNSLSWKDVQYASSIPLCQTVVDITGGKARTITTIVFELFWSIGLILLPTVSIVFNKWSHMYIAISTPSLALLFLYQVIPDSPRWFVRHGDLVRAKQIILEGARVNKLKVPDDVDDLLQSQSDAM